ncbi:hypothetical protein ACHQM5_019555 [Ranunculus cassubicifolius]
MFTLIEKNLLHRRTNSWQSLYISPLSLLQFISTDSITTHQKSFTISYLINSCGLSQQKAISAAKKFHFESPTNPDSVLTLFRNNGFSDSQISKTIARIPEILVFKVDKTLKPKFDFFNSKGLSGDELAKTLCTDPCVLTYSLENRIIPCFDFLRRIVGTDDKVVKILKRGVLFLRRNPQKYLAPNIEILRAHGVPEDNIVKLLVSQPRVLGRRSSSFREIVEQVKKMEIHILQYQFLVAVQVLDSMSKSSLEAKFDVYRRWGWSDDEIQCALRKKPNVMAISEEKIMSTMDFLVNKMRYDPSFIAEQPHVLAFSLEKRTVPRCSVLEVLIRDGLVEKFPDLVGLLNMSESDFLKKYVTEFEKKVPALLNIYQGKKEEIV